MSDADLPLGLDKDLDVAGEKAPAWCQRVVAHIAHLQAQLNRIRARDEGLSRAEEEIAEKVSRHLGAARMCMTHMSRWWARPFGVPAKAVDRTVSNIHKAEVKLLQLLKSKEELTWAGTVVLAQAKQHLGDGDPRLTALAKRLQEGKDELKPQLKDLAVSTLLAAHDAEETERARVRSFRNILAVSTFIIGVIAAFFALWGFVAPGQLPENLCFTPQGQTASPQASVEHVCPLGGEAGRFDVLAVEALGLGAATLTGAVSIRKIQGSATSYSVPVMLVLLRLPVGALSGLFGILLIQGMFIPGLSDLDSGPQILAWAIFFGILQESVTRMVDNQGRDLLKGMREPVGGD
ncbi:hypothetical protein ACPF8X_20035 [Streptomyces sp. G35A]